VTMTVATSPFSTIVALPEPVTWLVGTAASAAPNGAPANFVAPAAGFFGELEVTRITATAAPATASIPPPAATARGGDCPAQIEGLSRLRHSDRTGRVLPAVPPPGDASADGEPACGIRSSLRAARYADALRISVPRSFGAASRTLPSIAARRSPGAR